MRSDSENPVRVNISTSDLKPGSQFSGATTSELNRISPESSDTDTQEAVLHSEDVVFVIRVSWPLIISFRSLSKKNDFLHNCRIFSNHYIEIETCIVFQIVMANTRTEVSWKKSIIMDFC